MAFHWIIVDPHIRMYSKIFQSIFFLSNNYKNNFIPIQKPVQLIQSMIAKNEQNKLLNIMEYGKKKSKGSSNEKNLLKTIYQKPKIKTEPSPKNDSLNKDKINSALKNFNATKISQNKNYRSQTKDSNPRLRIKSRCEINVPNIRTSLTPKSLHYVNGSDSKVQSTKNKDNERFLTTGRIDLKTYFEKKKMSKSKQLERAYSREGNHKRLSPKGQSSMNVNRDQETTIKVNQRNEDGFDVRVYLTPEQYEKFGDRFPDKFKRVALLGRGGFSVVWLGIHRASKKKVAIKQILTSNPHQTHLKQIWFGSYFYQKGGEPRQQFQNHIGINNICKLYYHEIKTVDTWLYYQVCDESLGSCLFELKGETVNGQRNYRMFYRPLIYEIKNNLNELKNLVIEITKALYLINSHNIVHSDLKTQNILIKVKGKLQTQGPYVKQLKLIDFGSSFLFTNLKQFSMATPQYMPPEILNYIMFQNKLEYDEQMLKKMDKYLNPWTIDIWSLGCIILEIVSGLPLWMSIPTKIEGINQKVSGLFAVKGRLFNKIISKQIDVVENLQFNLNHKNYSGIQLDEDFRKILERMLSLQPEQRISPVEVLNHFGVPCKPHRMPFY